MIAFVGALLATPGFDNSNTTADKTKQGGNKICPCIRVYNP